MNNQVNPKDYLWVVTELIEDEDTMVGLSQEDGQTFIPATETKEECLALLAQLPTSQGGKREVAATHKTRLLEESKDNDFKIYIVNARGEILRELEK